MDGYFGRACLQDGTKPVRGSVCHASRNDNDHGQGRIFSSTAVAEIRLAEGFCLLKTGDVHSGSRAVAAWGDSPTVQMVSANHRGKESDEEGTNYMLSLITR